ncbi:MAG: hypothetical protein RSE65_04655 [Hafnia sp.]
MTLIIFTGINIVGFPFALKTMGHDCRWPPSLAIELNVLRLLGLVR